jgi:hypothetical protein
MLTSPPALRVLCIGKLMTKLPLWPRVEPDVDYAPLGAVSAGANRVDPGLGDDAESLHHDLMVHGASPSMPGLPAWGDAVPAPVFSGAMGLRVAVLLLSGSPVLGSSLVNWGQVEDRTEQACS